MDNKWVPITKEVELYIPYLDNIFKEYNNSKLLAYRTLTDGSYEFKMERNDGEVFYMNGGRDLNIDELM